MSSTPEKPKTCLRKTRRRTSRRTMSSRKRFQARSCRPRRSINNGGRTCSKVSDKLEALKNLIPAQNDSEIVKPDQLFQETADYIVLLRSQVVILQRLVDFYGSSAERDNVVL